MSLVIELLLLIGGAVIWGLIVWYIGSGEWDNMMHMAEKRRLNQERRTAKRGEREE